MTPEDRKFLKMAIAEAIKAKKRGDYPFGAVLVHNGTLVGKQSDWSYSKKDLTKHAELQLISDYCRKTKSLDLSGHTLYSSTEPCNMCAGAIHWARISRIVYSVPQAELNKISGVKEKMPCQEIINSCDRYRAEIIGPMLFNEGIAVFEDFPMIPKRIRHTQES